MKTRLFDAQHKRNLIALALPGIPAAAVAVAVASVLSCYKMSRMMVCRRENRPLDYKSPFFIQERIGWHGKLIRVYKFQTMRDVNPSSPYNDDAHRVINGIGTFLRRTGLDELPQLWNIVKGEMAINGGMRPKTFDEVALIAGLQRDQLPSVKERFEKELRTGRTTFIDVTHILHTEQKIDDKHAVRLLYALEVRPSIIGASQVAKGVDKTPGNVDAARTMVRLQLGYMRHRFPLLKDMQIIGQAMLKVLCMKGDNIKPQRPSAAQLLGVNEEVPENV